MAQHLNKEHPGCIYNGHQRLLTLYVVKFFDKCGWKLNNTLQGRQELMALKLIHRFVNDLWLIEQFAQNADVFDRQQPIFCSWNFKVSSWQQKQLWDCLCGFRLDQGR